MSSDSAIFQDKIFSLIETKFLSQVTVLLALSNFHNNQYTHYKS